MILDTCRRKSRFLRVGILHLIGITLCVSIINADDRQPSSKVPQNSFHSRSETGKRDSQRPHIIIIVADDLGYNDVVFHGSHQIPTPNIDFLAYNGIILNNYYVSPICTPTRATLMTGRYPIHTGMQDSVIVGAQPWGLPLNETLLPQYLNQLGYRSHMVGKWHLGMFKWEYTPLFRGFESHFGYWQGAEDYYTHTYEASMDYWGLDFRRGLDILWNHTGDYSTFLFRDEALNVIERHDVSEPLFLYLPFQAVHTGNQDDTVLQAPKEYIDKFSYIENIHRRTYAGMVSALDDAIGDVYDALKKKGMLDNLIILFTTDNGGPANGVDQNAANNFPLRGTKYTLWEGGLRGVGLINSPLLNQQGYVSNKLLHVSDWLPTLVSAAGGGHLLNFTLLDGVDAWKMLSEDGDAVRTELLHNIDPRFKSAAIRVGDYKLVVGNGNQEGVGGWYPPYQLVGDEMSLNYINFDEGPGFSHTAGDVHSKSPSASHGIREHLMSKYSSQWPQSVLDRIEELSIFAENSKLYNKPQLETDSRLLWKSENERENLRKRGSDTQTYNLKNKSFINQDQGSVFGFRGEPVKVECGPKPANASTNCQPHKSPCLYHIPSDPCEYNNIAAWNNETVTHLLNRISYYSSTMVPSGYKPPDPKGNPTHHGGAWVPWLSQ